MQRKNVISGTNPLRTDAPALGRHTNIQYHNLGIAGGNGLEHSVPHVKSIVGVDINADYLATARRDSHRWTNVFSSSAPIFPIRFCSFRPVI
jgi:hypothetical protein